MADPRASNKNIFHKINDQLVGIENTLALFTFGFLILSVIAYFTQAYIFERQLRIMEDQETRQLRAYVGGTAGHIVGYYSPNTIVVRSAFKNFGTTPAYRFTFTHTQEFVGKPEDNIFKIGDGKESSPAHVTLFPSDEQNWRDYANASDEQMKDFNEGKLVVLYYGVASYLDAFGKKRKERFCYYFTKGDLDLFFKKSEKSAGQKCNNDDVVLSSDDTSK